MINPTKDDIGRAVIYQDGATSRGRHPEKETAMTKKTKSDFNAALALVRVELVKKPERNERQEPAWSLPFELGVRRMDSSLAMTMEMGSYTDKVTGEVVSIAVPMGGIGVVLYTSGKDGKSTGVYSVSLLPLVEAFMALAPEFAKVKNFGIQKRPETKKRKKR